MQIGLLTDSLSTLTRAEALDTAAELGVETVEIGLGGTHGGWSPAPHADLLELLSDSSARETLTRDITSRGLRLEAFNAAGNPLHPLEGARDDKVLRGALQLAEELEIGTVVTMSGLPAASGDGFPAWITTVWPPENGRLLEHQWTVAVDYWGSLAEEASRRGVNVAVEMHANQLVYNVPGLRKLRAAVGETVGANFDPSHLFWQQADPVEAIRELGTAGALFHVHAKDTYVDRGNVSRNGVIDTKDYTRFLERAWTFRTVGYGQGEKVWRDMISALRMVGYDHVMSIEHEDGLMSVDEGLEKAVQFLSSIMLKDSDQAEMWWA